MAPTSGARATVDVGDVVVPCVPVDDDRSGRAAEQAGGGLPTAVAAEDVGDKLAREEGPDEASLVGTILQAKACLVGLAVRVGDDASEQPVVERREDLGRAMDQVPECAACDGNAKSREVLLGAVGRHRVAALADDEVRDEAGAVLRAIEYAQRCLGASDVLAAAAGDDLLDVAATNEVARNVVPLGRELASANRLRHLAAVGALADALGDGVLDRFLSQPRGVFGAWLLFSLGAVARWGLALRVVRGLSSGRFVRVAQLSIDGYDALGGPPEQALLVLGDLRQRRGELGLCDLPCGALGLELARQFLGARAPTALVLGRHERALITSCVGCPSIGASAATNRRSMSSMPAARPCGGWGPMLGATNVLDVDAIEEHAELSRVEGDPSGSLADARKAEAAPLEALVVDDEAASIPEEDLDPVAAASDEDEEMAGERVHTPLVAHDGKQAIVTAAQVHRLGRQVDMDARR